MEDNKKNPQDSNSNQDEGNKTENEIDYKSVVETLKKELEALKTTISTRDYDDTIKSQNFHKDNIEFVKTLSKDKYEKDGIEGVKKMWSEDKRFDLFKQSPNLNEVPTKEPNKDEVDKKEKPETNKEILLEIQD